MSKVKVEQDINATPQMIWKVITDIENADKNISAISKVEILEKPSSGLIGLKWKETRNMFGKEATETMWIVEADENNYYKVHSRNHGAAYTSILEIVPNENNSKLIMSFEAEIESFIAKCFNKLLFPLFKSATIKALAKDLEDIKQKVESK